MRKKECFKLYEVDSWRKKSHRFERNAREIVRTNIDRDASG